MKKLLLGLIVFIFPFIVFAALVPYEWTVDGEDLYAQDSTNKAGTATIHKDGYVVTLTLNNYKGGALKEKCVGTGVEEIEFKIVLEGENTITADDIGIEMETSGKKITFEGTGTLKITAPTPISNEEYVNEAIIDPSGSLKEEENNKNQLVSENEKEEVEDEAEDILIAPKEEEKTNYIIPIIVGIAAFIIGCGLGFVLSKGKKKTEEKPL